MTRVRTTYRWGNEYVTYSNPGPYPPEFWINALACSIAALIALNLFFLIF